MCDARGSEPGLKGAPCFALSVLVRVRYPDASPQLVQDFENLLAEVINRTPTLLRAWQTDPIATLHRAWKQQVDV